MIDKSDDYTINKPMIDSLPFRMIICGKSGLGKTSLLGSLLLLPEFYGKDFKGENIFIFSPLKNDFKMETIIEQKNIPEENIFTEFDDDILNAIYDNITDDYEMRVKEGLKPIHKIVILDDLSFSGCLKGGLYNSINRFFMNGRKHLASIIITSQKYSQISTGQRSNASSIIFYNSSMKEKELLETDANYLESKSKFMKMLSDNITNKRDFIVVNHSNELKDLYLNKDFETITT
jgi:hypothetical protein